MIRDLSKRQKEKMIILFKTISKHFSDFGTALDNVQKKVHVIKFIVTILSKKNCIS